jgi:hypothetical protein
VGQAQPSLVTPDAVQWLPADRACSGLVAVLYIIACWRVSFLPWEKAAMFTLIAAFAAAWACIHVAPRRYLRWRTPVIMTLRLSAMLLPLALDVIDALQPVHRHSASAARAGESGLGAAGRAMVALFLGISWFRFSGITAVGLQLPPWQHLAVQLGTSLVVCRRAAPRKPCCAGFCCAQDVLLCGPCLFVRHLVVLWSTAPSCCMVSDTWFSLYRCCSLPAVRHAGGDQPEGGRRDLHFTGGRHFPRVPGRMVAAGTGG